MTTDLSIDELGWLLGLASARRRSREQSLERSHRKPGQSETEYQDGRHKIERSLAWARRVEDHLILLLGNTDQGYDRLRAPQRDRYEELRTLPAAARYFPVAESPRLEPNPALLDRSDEMRSIG